MGILTWWNSKHCFFERSRIALDGGGLPIDGCRYSRQPGHIKGSGIKWEVDGGGAR